MIDISRIKALSGTNPRQETLSSLQDNLSKINESYKATLDAIKNDRQLDEGLFTNLKAALGTVGKIGKTGAQAVAAKARQISASVKEIYLDKKAQVELKILVDGLRKSIEQFEKMEADAPTISKRDPEVKRELELFRSLFGKMIESLAARQTVTEGVELHEAAVRDMLIEHGLMDAPVLNLDSYSNLSEVFKSAEYAEVSKKLKLISTHTQLREGTLVFDAGFRGVNLLGEEVGSSKYLFSIDKDGQVAAEVRGLPWVSASKYNLGEPAKGTDQLDTYRKALTSVMQRYEKKAARHQQDLVLIQKQCTDWNTRVAQFNGGSDAREVS